MLATNRTVGTVYPTITNVSLDGVPSQVAMLGYVPGTHADPVGYHFSVSDTASELLRRQLALDHKD